MKTSIPITAILLLSGLVALAQSTIQMTGRSGTFLQAQVFGVSEPFQKQGNMATNFPAGTQTYGGALLAGSGFYAQLWSAPNGTPEDSLLAVAGSLTTFRTGAFAGFWASPASAVALPGIPEGGIATLQVRAWDNVGGTITSWDQLWLPANIGVARGVSAVFLSTPSGGLGTPPVLENVRSFNIWIIPEPHPMALLSLTGLGLWLFRARNRRLEIRSQPLS